MKRSLAPSAIYENKKLKYDLPDIVETTPDDSDKGKRGRKKAPIPTVNHLEKYSIKKKVELKDEDNKSDDSSGSGSSNGDKIREETKKGKNQRMNPDSDPYYFLIKYKNTTKNDEEDGLGILILYYDQAIVQSIEGRQIGKTSLTRGNDDDDDGKGQYQKVMIKKKEVYFQEDFAMAIGNKWIKIILSVSEEEFKNGSIFLKTDSIIKKKKEEKKEKKAPILAAAHRPKGFQVPVKGLEKAVRLSKPLHNPLAPNSLVLFTPVDITGENRIHCVVDPLLSQKLRPHQREGVQFMFDCLLGFRGGFKGNGCILADDMGLGKSIQAITILWTLLKQGPKGESTAKKAVIVAPCSLVGNWGQELKKWLGDGINTVAIGESTKTGRAKLTELEFGKADVLIISYDQLRIYCEDICKITSIGLVICDEGHRLKNAEIKTTKAVSMIPTARRVILSGTPIQNDLTEFYAMVNFVNPGVLKNVATFKNVYDAPIVASRNPDASEEEKEIGRQRSLELSRLTSQFILRRTAFVNTQYLPPKVEYVIFCKLTPLQLSIYKHLIKEAKDSAFASTTGALPLITTLKKLSNCAELVYTPDKETDVGTSILKLFPKEWNPKVFQPQYSSKLLFVDRLLANIRNSKSGDKTVIISNYTQTLEVLATMCKTRGYAYFQLDGSTPNAKRQQLVNLYNDPARPEFVFLLSSKAGGVGLNLIGGNHLVLFDADWNPANDAQSMARVWREGQKKIVSIYRTFTTGTIEEKIFQRQLTKQALSTSITEGDSDNSPSFDSKDLKDIFTLREDTLCDTHDMLSCKCAPTVGGKIPKHKRDTMSISELNSWHHFHQMEKIKDQKVASACQDIATFVFVNDKGPVDKNKSKENNQSTSTSTTTTSTTTSTFKSEKSSSPPPPPSSKHKKKIIEESSDEDDDTPDEASSDESYNSDSD
ncbi:hypothetical protein ACTFIZ_012799 [Dictyostelium cf. discoideum]